MRLLFSDFFFHNFINDKVTRQNAKFLRNEDLVFSIVKKWILDLEFIYKMHK